MQSVTQDKTFQQIPAHVKFKQLPSPIQERLLNRQSGEGEAFVFKTDGVIVSYFLIIVSAIWFGESIPAETISYDSVSEDENYENKDFAEVLNEDKGNIYNSMVSSAFDDFKANLVFKMGIGKEPERVTEDNPNKGIASTTTKKSPK